MVYSSVMTLKSKKVLKRGKRVQSVPAPEAMYAELEADADIVITGSGD